MSARERIEGLTNAWYGFALFAAMTKVLISGFGIFTMVIAGFGLVINLALSYFLGRRLLARSSFTRSLLLVVAVISGVFGAFACFRYGTAFLASWSFGLIFRLALSVGLLMMNIRSVRVLTDASVKSYIGG